MNTYDDPSKKRHPSAKIDIINPPFLNPDEDTWMELQRDFIYQMREDYDGRFRMTASDYSDFYYGREHVREFDSIEKALDTLH